MESGAQPGNDNASKGAEWRQAIKRALAHKSGKTYREGLDKVAKEFVDAACKGDQWEVNHLGDRMDDKPAQSIDLGGELKLPLSGTVKYLKDAD